jgi:hypothetical protein
LSETLKCLIDATGAQQIVAASATQLL